MYQDPAARRQRASGAILRLQKIKNRFLLRVTRGGNHAGGLMQQKPVKFTVYNGGAVQCDRILLRINGSFRSADSRTVDGHGTAADLRCQLLSGKRSLSR